jgi:DNA-binding PadR family transcriptional regulator
MKKQEYSRTEEGRKLARQEAEKRERLASEAKKLEGLTMTAEVKKQEYPRTGEGRKLVRQRAKKWEGSTTKEECPTTT